MRNVSKHELMSMTSKGLELWQETLMYNMENCSVRLRQLQGEQVPEAKRPGTLVVSNGDIIKSLKDDYGIRIKSVAELYSILQNMGLVESVCGKWKQTAAGMEYSIFKYGIEPANIWLDTLIDKIATYKAGQEE